ncbi:MAG: DeoR family transcriptional regulator [Syntrophorhabdaceae bacterium]
MKRKADTHPIASASDAIPIDKYAAKAMNYLKNRTVMTMNGDTPVNFSSDNTIVAYRLETAITDILGSMADKLKVTICWADCVTDLIAVPAFMNIINPLGLTEEETDEIFQWFSFLEETGDPSSFCVLFTSAPPFKIPPKVGKYVLRTPEFIDNDYLKLKILNKRASTTRHNNQHQSYDRKIFRLLKILKVLKSEGIMYVEDMCNEFNITPKTVRRDIELWNALGEIIEYDRNKKGYVLAYSDDRVYDLS